MSHRAVEIDDRETIVVGGSIASVVLATIYALARVGFENQMPEVLRSLGLSLFILAIPYWLWRAFRKRDSDFVWVRSQPFITLAAVAFTAAIALVSGPAASGVGLTLSTLGFIGALIVLFSWLRNGGFRSRIIFSLGATVVSAWAAGVVWTSRYKMPLYWETFVTNANVHHDPVYLIAIGNMLRTYGVASTGLEGVPYTFYHYGTPWLFSRWADLVNTDLMSFYSLGYALILIPLLFASIAMLAVEARKASLLPRTQGWLRSNWWGWLAVSIGTIGIIPDSAMYAMAIWNAHALISESYLGGLPIFMMVIATCIIAWRAEQRSLVLLFVFLPLALAALAFLKISLMVLLFGMVVYVLFRTRVLWTLTGAASTAVMFIAGYLAYKAVALPAHNGGITAFHFIRNETLPGWHQFFLLAHFAWTWVYVAGRMFEERIDDVAGFWAAVKARSIIDVEVLLGVSLLGFLPGAVLLIHGGSAIYFSDVPRWLALALLLARVGHWRNLWRERHGSRAPAANSMRLAPILAVFIAAPFIATMFLNTIKPPLRLLRQNISLRSDIVSRAGAEAELGAGNRKLLVDPETLEAGLRRGTYYDIVTALREIGAIPAGEKDDMVLFIPQSYRNYWAMFDVDDRCTYVGFVAPSVSEMAMIDGMPAFGCKITDQYNMQLYAPRERDQLPADVTDTALCARAGAKGFSRVMILAPDQQGAPRRRVVECVT